MHDSPALHPKLQLLSESEQKLLGDGGVSYIIVSFFHLFCPSSSTYKNSFSEVQPAGITSIAVYGTGQVPPEVGGRPVVSSPANPNTLI